LRAFGATSRVRLLYELVGGAETVEQPAVSVAMETSAVSQHRVLRQLRFEAAQRRGRHVRYRLHDDHVAELLAASAITTSTPGPPSCRRLHARSQRGE